MENEKPYNGRDNCYFLKQLWYQKLFPVIYSNCPETYYKLILIYKEDFWQNVATPEIKHEILCNDYKAECWKYVDILNNILALQCSW